MQALQLSRLAPLHGFHEHYMAQQELSHAEERVKTNGREGSGETSQDVDTSDEVVCTRINSRRIHDELSQPSYWRETFEKELSVDEWYDDATEDRYPQVTTSEAHELHNKAILVPSV